MENVKTRRWGPFRQEWYSICSGHNWRKYTEETCPRCQKGQWINVWRQAAGSFVFERWPDVWRWWANHRWNVLARAESRWLESVFPGLRRRR